MLTINIDIQGRSINGQVWEVSQIDNAQNSVQKVLLLIQSWFKGDDCKLSQEKKLLGKD